MDAPGDRDGLAMPHASEGLGTRSFEVMAPHPIGEVFFDGVRVPGRHMLGPGEGMKLALANLARFRVAVAAAANGFASRALSESSRTLPAPAVRPAPLELQGLRFDLAEMDVRLRAAELLTDEAAAAVDASHQATAEVAAQAVRKSASWICDQAGITAVKACASGASWKALSGHPGAADLRGDERGPEARAREERARPPRPPATDNEVLRCPRATSE